MKERGKLLNNTVVTMVMSNFGLYKAFDEHGIGYAKTAVGDKYVYEYMAKNGCRIGAEWPYHFQQVRKHWRWYPDQSEDDGSDAVRILVRESGTEPIVRVMVEAPDYDSCQKYVDEVVNVICKKGYKA